MSPASAEGRDTRLRDLAAAANAAAGREAVQWVGFVTLTVLLAATVGTVTDTTLLAEGEVRLPLLSIALPLRGFAWAAPAIYIVVHFYTLAQLTVLRRKVTAFLEAAERQAPAGSEAHALSLALLDGFPVVQLMAADRLRQPALPLRLMVGVSLVVAPVLLLLLVLLRFLPWQSAATTWAHRGFLAADLALLWWLLPPAGTAALAAAAGTLAALSLAAIAATPGAWLDSATPALSTTRDALFGTPGAAPPFLARRHLDLAGQRLVAPLPALAGRRLRHARLDRADLTGADLRGADLRGASLIGTTLDQARLDQADLTDAQLSGASLIGASLLATALNGASFSPTAQLGLTITPAVLREAVLDWASLDGASLRGADLRGASLDGASLVGADLSEAKLQGASLRARMRMTGSGAGFRPTTLANATLDGAMLDGAVLLYAHMPGASLRGASLRGALLGGPALPIDGPSPARCCMAPISGPSPSPARRSSVPSSRARRCGMCASTAPRSPTWPPGASRQTTRPRAPLRRTGASMPRRRSRRARPGAGAVRGTRRSTRRWATFRTRNVLTRLSGSDGFARARRTRPAAPRPEPRRRPPRRMRWFPASFLLRFVLHRGKDPSSPCPVRQRGRMRVTCPTRGWPSWSPRRTMPRGARCRSSGSSSSR
jgi:uncharacterized protein YjbI with pentapeptide repeats